MSKIYSDRMLVASEGQHLDGERTVSMASFDDWSWSMGGSHYFGFDDTLPYRRMPGLEKAVRKVD